MTRETGHVTPVAYSQVLYVLNKHNLSVAYLSLSDWYSLYCAALPTQVFAQEVVAHAADIPSNVTERGVIFEICGGVGSSHQQKTWRFCQLLWNSSVLKQLQYFQLVLTLFLVSGSLLARGTILQKHVFALGVIDRVWAYFPNKNHCAVFPSQDNRILLALAAAKQFHVYQTDIVQASLHHRHGVLDDVDIYILLKTASSPKL